MAPEMPPAAVLAGGLGTRIRDIARDVPKVLLPVAGRPFLAHLLEFLAGEGIRKAVLCLGHGAEAVWTAARSHVPAGMDLVESREAEPLGTAGAVHNAGAALGATFFLVNGDTYFPAPLTRLLAVHTASRALATLALVRSDAAAEKGTVRVDGDGRVVAFAEKTREGSGLLNGGVYVMDADLLAGCRPGVPCSLEREVLPAALDGERPVMGCVTDAPFVDIGLPQDYLRIRDGLPPSREDA
jgi:NDP-sugar pyrophosphorylase family protein